MRKRIPVLIAKATPNPKIENIKGEKKVTNYVHTGQRVKIPSITQKVIDFKKNRNH